MLSLEAASEWREVVRPLQEAAAVLEEAALHTRQLNADLSATQVELRASEFELSALRAEHAAAQRTLQAHKRESRYQRQVYLLALHSQWRPDAFPGAMVSVYTELLLLVLMSTSNRVDSAHPCRRERQAPKSGVSGYKMSWHVREARRRYWHWLSTGSSTKHATPCAAKTSLPARTQMELMWTLCRRICGACLYMTAQLMPVSQLCSRASPQLNK